MTESPRSPSIITARLSLVAYPLAVLALASLAPTPAHADFFDGARQTFTSDIPHFFQDDIPCFFGGQPTSRTRTACKSSNPELRRAPEKERDSAAAPPDRTSDEQRPDTER